MKKYKVRTQNRSDMKMKRYISIIVVGIFLIIPVKGFSWSIFGPDLDEILESQENAYTFLKACVNRDTLNSSCEEFDEKISEIGTEVDNHRKTIDECAAEGNPKCKKILSNLGYLRKTRIMQILSD
jgi:peptidoglycan hydrolase CwlO-like protein